ncbi:hypothetical protein AgCh_029471 [Apium graveolens]
MVVDAIKRDWGSWLRAPPRRAAGGSRSKWLREDGDENWGRGAPHPQNLLESFRTTVEDWQLSEIDIFGGGAPHPQNLLESFRTTVEDWQLSEIDIFGGGAPHPQNLLESFRTTVEDWQLSEIDIFGGFAYNGLRSRTSVFGFGLSGYSKENS